MEWWIEQACETQSVKMLKNTIQTIQRQPRREPKEPLVSAQNTRTITNNIPNVTT